MTRACEVMEGVQHVRLPHADLHLHVARARSLVPTLGLPDRLHLGVVTSEVDGLGMGSAAHETAGRVLRGEGVLRLKEEDGESELGGVTLGQRLGEETAGQIQAENKAR